MKCTGCGRHLITAPSGGLCSTCREIRGDGTSSVREEVRKTMPRDVPKPIPPHQEDLQPRRKPVVSKNPVKAVATEKQPAGEMSQMGFFEHAAKTFRDGVNGENLFQRVAAYPIKPAFKIPMSQFKKLNPPDDIPIPEGTEEFVVFLENGDIDESAGKLRAKLMVIPIRPDDVIDMDLNNMDEFAEVPEDVAAVGTVKDVKPSNPEPSPAVLARSKDLPSQPCQFAECNSMVAGKCVGVPAIYAKCEENPVNQKVRDEAEAVGGQLATALEDASDDTQEDTDAVE